MRSRTLLAAVRRVEPRGTTVWDAGSALFGRAGARGRAWTLSARLPFALTVFTGVHCIVEHPAHRQEGFHMIPVGLYSYAPWQPT